MPDFKNIVVALLVALNLAGCINFGKPNTLPPTGVLHRNSCSIICPAKPVETERTASVVCRKGYVPVCQCSNPDESLAYCQAVSE